MECIEEMAKQGSMKAPGQAAFEAFASVMSPGATWETRSMKERGAWVRAEAAARGAPTTDGSSAGVNWDRGQLGH